MRHRCIMQMTCTISAVPAERRADVITWKQHRLYWNLSACLLHRFFEESPEAMQLFDGNGDFESPEFLAHARRLITSLRTEIQQLGDSDHHHHHHGDAALSSTTPAIHEVCITCSLSMIRLVPCVSGMKISGSVKNMAESNEDEEFVIYN